MHAAFRIGETTLMASDGNKRASHVPGHLAYAHGSQRRRGGSVVRALQDGGKVQLPLTKTFFSSRFGMVADRFGVAWMIVVMP